MKLNYLRNNHQRAFGAGVMAMALGALLAGCDVNNEIESGKYLCTKDSDCPWGWQCAADSVGKRKCFNPSAVPDAGPGGDDTPVLDTGPKKSDTGWAQSDATSTKDDTSIKDDTGSENKDVGLPEDTVPSQVCTPNTPECVDLGSFRTCNAAGTGYDAPAVNCPDQQRCESGACVDAADVTGSILFKMFVVEQHIPPGPPAWAYYGDLNATFRYGNTFEGSDFPHPDPDTCIYHLESSSSGTEGVAFDAGLVTVTGISTGARTLTFDPAENSQPASPPVLASDFPYGMTRQFAGQGKNLVHGPFSGTISVPPLRLVITPEVYSHHPRNQPLTVTWSGATGSGTVKFFLRATGTYSRLTCAVKDDGEFTIPASHLSSFSFVSPGSVVSITLWDSRSTAFLAPGLKSGKAGGVVIHNSSFYLD